MKRCAAALGQAAADDALEQIFENYDRAIRSVLVLPKEMDSLTQQLSLLALFLGAKYQPAIANQLRHLADRLNPGSGASAEAPKSKTTA